jgi:hypothetical protein
MRRLNFRSLVTRSRHLSSGRESVMNTLNRFLWCMDRNDPDTFASLFTDDGTLEITKTNKIYNSPLLIKGFCSDIYTKFSPALHLVSLSLTLLPPDSLSGIELCDQYRLGLIMRYK